MEKPTNHWNKVNSWSEELDLLHNIIAKTELVETTKWGGLVYTINGKNVVGIGGFKNYFTIWFFNGVFLKDEQKLLVNAQEGVTKALRQWRFTDRNEVDEKLVLEYIHEAIENEIAEKFYKPTKKNFAIDVLLQNEFSKDNELENAFDELSKSKQNDFLEYILTAKQEKTKLGRIEKIKPMIMAKIGLNDKYK
jgi:uncharacterized protein YdeI (YjbR/CyaY-like superfamily)